MSLRDELALALHEALARGNWTTNNFVAAIMPIIERALTAERAKVTSAEEVRSRWVYRNHSSV